MYYTLRKFSFLVLFFVSSAAATEFYEPIQTIRQLGMGGVYVFNPHDGGSYLQNPAYTCMVKGFNWSMVNGNLAVGDLQNIDFIQNLSTSDERTPTAANLSTFMGKSVSVRLDGFSAFSIPCFGMGLYHNALGNFQVQNPAYPHIDTFYLTETGFSIGGGIPLGDNLALGLAVKRIQRRGGPYSFGPESISLLDEADGFTTMLSSVENGGLGYGLDAGFVARLGNSPLNPTAALSWRDLGSTAFTKSSGVTAPERQKDNLVMGLTFDGSLPLIGIAGGLEYRHITDTNEQIGKKIHMGLELSLAMFDIRAGLYQGYTTYGAAVDLWLIQLQGSLYSVEQGVYPGQTPEQRGQFGLSIDLEFDPDFKLVDSGGKKRRLKQRR